jgi:hypothetical protein
VRPGSGQNPCAGRTAPVVPRLAEYACTRYELDGTDLRREPIEVRKATLASILRKSRPGVRLNEHLAHDCGLTVFRTPASSGARGSCPGDWDRITDLGVHQIG